MPHRVPGTVFPGHLGLLGQGFGGQGCPGYKQRIATCALQAIRRARAQKTSPGSRGGIRSKCCPLAHAVAQADASSGARDNRQRGPATLLRNARGAGGRASDGQREKSGRGTA